jgi:hypothetical protein
MAVCRTDTVMPWLTSPGQAQISTQCSECKTAVLPDRRNAACYDPPYTALTFFESQAMPSQACGLLSSLKDQRRFRTENPRARIRNALYKQYTHNTITMGAGYCGAGRCVARSHSYLEVSARCGVTSADTCQAAMKRTENGDHMFQPRAKRSRWLKCAG